VGEDLRRVGGPAAHPVAQVLEQGGALRGLRKEICQLTRRPFSLPLLIITQTKTQYPLDRIISLSYNQTRLGKPMNCIGKERQ